MATPAAHGFGSPAWADRAACRGMDPDSFITTRWSATIRAIIVTVCKGCPVRAECAQWGEASHSVGIWGRRLRKTPTG